MQSGTIDKAGILRDDFDVVDFVAVKAQTINKDQ
jgi:hypothetical protein